jgi:hypothetical protein
MRALRAVAYLTNALQVRTLVVGEQFRGCASPGLPPLEVDVGERPPVGVADDEARAAGSGEPSAGRVQRQRHHVNSAPAPAACAAQGARLPRASSRCDLKKAKALLDELHA